MEFVELKSISKIAKNFLCTNLCLVLRLSWFELFI